MLRGRVARRHLRQLVVALGRQELRPVGARYASTQSDDVKRVYVIAGEASGDAIGAKVIAALQRKQSLESTISGRRVVVRGIGGSQMTSIGGFRSLFPMQDLSVMGLLEVVPHILRLRRRFHETLDDIHAFRPDLVLTIDSKGFTFRVQRALASDPQLRDTMKRMHYVAPSVWAYKHRQRTNHDTANGEAHPLTKFLHKMFVILPFEESIFLGAHDKPRHHKGFDRWCAFVGHPAVEDFLEYHGVYSEPPQVKKVQPPTSPQSGLQISEGGLLQRMRLDPMDLLRRGTLFEQLMTRRRADPAWQTAYRKSQGLPPDAFIICALVGSRENEVRQTIQTVLKAVDAMQRPSEQLIKAPFGIPMKLSPLYTTGCVSKRPIHVVFPTLASLQPLVQREIDSFSQQSTSSHSSSSSNSSIQIAVDVSASKRIELFQAADAAVAVSGTIVMETTLAALPTVVIYRANRVTEILAKLLSAVQFVSIPNLLLGRAEIPELLFRDCTPENITRTLRTIYNSSSVSSSSSSSPSSSDGPSQLAMALSTLTPWLPHDNTAMDIHTAHGDRTSQDAVVPVPVRGSDLVADAVWQALYDSKDTFYQPNSA